ncbi:hypothetical protein RJT34_00683 [Clitoria ternatea]|uniref:Exostosin GT47 domain-containing protein n=1 Tax=Clitoria ternatea TaxID=43366 RepID=A0AAN9PY62_CLITE
MRALSSKCSSSSHIMVLFFLITSLLLLCWSFLVPNFSTFLVSRRLKTVLEPTSSLIAQGKTASTLHGHHAFPSQGDEKLDTKLKKIEAKLAKARYFIKEASRVRNLTSTFQDPDYVPQGPIYRNANTFHRSYLEMEKVFKIFVYEEGEAPLFHMGLSKGIYCTEGRFVDEMEKGRYYRTNDPDEAFVYYLPFSVVMMVQYLYEDGSRNTNPIGLAVKDYIHLISHKHPFWNRSSGHDHFMLSCHDWGPMTSSYVDHLFNNAIRVLCNANSSEGFKPLKDVSLPEINLIKGKVTGLGVSYYTKLRSSKFCLCPSGYEVASPRITEAIFAECVPVLISDGYVPPFSDVLKWESFSVQVAVKDIPKIKRILMGISQKQYLRMLRRVKQVQRHFVPNEPPKRFDVFHMIVHSIWLRRLNIHIQDQ